MRIIYKFCAVAGCMNFERRFSGMINKLIGKPKLAGLLVIVFLFLIIGLITKQRYEIIKESEHAEMTSMLNVVKQNIDQSLKNSYAATLAIALTINDEGKPVDFEKVAAQLVGSNSDLQAVELVPAGIIKYVYPLKGNEAALNINVFDQLNQEVAKGAMKAVGYKRMYFSGPFKLRQGNQGIVGRLPVFKGEKFWGFAAVVIKLDVFLKQAGIYNNSSEKFYFQFSKVNPATQKEEFFLPGEKKFSQHAHESISYSDGDWKLYIIVSNKYDIFLQLIYPLAFGLLLALTCGFLVMKLLEKQAALERLIRQQTVKLIDSRFRFKTLFDKAPIGIAEVDIKNDMFIEVNNKLCQIFGYTEEQFYKINFRSITFQDDQTAGSQHMQKLIEGTINEFALLKQYKHINGDLLWVNILVKSLWNEGEQPNSYMTIIEDVTDRKTAEKVAKDAQLRIASLINTIDGIVWEANPENFQFTFISKKTEEILGYSVEEWLNSHTFWADHVYPDDRSWVVEYCSVCTRSLKSHDFEYRMNAKDGSVVWLRDIVNVISEDGHPKLLRGIMIDITAQKKAQQDLRDSFKLVSEQNKRLLNFSYIVSHNLRSHTSNIQAIATLIDPSNSELEMNELTDLLKRASAALNETLIDLSQVVNIQASINVHVEALNLRQYISKTIRALNEEIVAKNVSIIESEDCDPIVNYNPAYLESILLNFIFNAIRYSHPDRRPVIELSCFKENDQQVLQISDNGVGIDLEKYGDELFGMYKTFNGNPDSKGIGLFMSKNQIDAMGGRVTVSSVLNEGTTFNIYFK